MTKAAETRAAKACGYCGKTTSDWDMEHVVPACLYPRTKKYAGVQRITIPACKACNASWQDDEVHFRAIALLAGESNLAVKDVWPKVSRSIQPTKKDGLRRLLDVVAQMKPVVVEGKQRHKLYPGKDVRVMRVVRKIIRGLCHFHGMLPFVTDQRVWADVQTVAIPPQFLSEMAQFERGPDVFSYRCAQLNDMGIHSVWQLTIYGRLPFFGFVTASEEGVSSLDRVEAQR